MNVSPPVATLPGAMASPLPSLRDAFGVLGTSEGGAPRLMPITALHRVDGRTVLLGMASHRHSLRRLRGDPRCALLVVGTGFALTCDGTARVLTESLPEVEGVVVVAFHADDIRDARNPATLVHGAVPWGWRDAASARRHASLCAGLARIAADDAHATRAGER